MDAAASPLPSDDTTPPVTKMYFTGLARSVCGMCALRSGRLRRVFVRAPDPPGYRSRWCPWWFRPCRFVNPCSRARSCSRLSARSSGVGGQRREAEQELAPVDVQPDVLPERWLAAGPHGRAATAVRLKYRASPRVSTTTLTTDGRDTSAGSVMRRRSVPIPRSARPATSATVVVDGFGGKERQIALHVHENLALERRGDFSEPVGAGEVIGARHHRDAAECVHRARNALVVGGHDHGVDRARVGRASIDVFDHRTSVDFGEWLTGKTRRLVAGGDDGDDSSRTD